MPDSVNITMNFVANTAVFGDINQRLNVVSNHVKNVTNQFTQVSNRVNNVTNNVNHLGDSMDRLSSVSSGIGGFFRKLGNFGMGAAGIITTFNAVTGKMKEFSAPTPTHHQPVQFRTAEAAAHMYRPSQGRASRVQHIDDQRREIHHSIERRRVVNAAHRGRLRVRKFLNSEILHFFVSLNFCCIFASSQDQVSWLWGCPKGCSRFLYIIFYYLAIALNNTDDVFHMNSYWSTIRF